MGVPAHLIHVIKRMNADLKVTFDLNGEPVEVPCTVGVKQWCPLSPTLFLFVMQACLESLEKAMPADLKLKYRTNTKTEGKNGGHVSSTDWTNQGMGNPGAGPRWLAKARYESAFQHWKTAAAATSVRH